MNKLTYRLVFSRLRNMLVAVEETASSAGKTSQGEAAGTLPAVSASGLYSFRFALHPVAFAVLALGGVIFAPMPAHAQIVPGGANAPSVIQAPNGLPQVNINRPSSAGVSLNTYGQFDVQKPGAILNNSPVITGTQQAGQINGNPNFGAGQSARIIVNQVNSRAASQINGYLEVAGQRAEVVIANGSGISVNGGGFLNTSRAILTTGTPNFASDGSLAGFNVSGGNITVQGAGLDGSTVDQVDLLARAVQVNAAIYAGKNLNVITGANQIGHDSLAFTPIAGDGPAPAVSIDVSQLGGMYSGRIFLASNEYGVGVSNQGVIAAQAGDLTLQSNGLLALTGKTSASGNLAATGSDIQNSGTTYAQQGATLSASGTFTNSGMLAAQQNTTVNAASVNSTGTLGAGINDDGSVGPSGDLNVTASGQLNATGQNVAGGNASLSGSGVNLAGSSTSANGALALAANSGDLNLSGATTTAGGTLNATATGTLTNDNGALSSGGAHTITAGALSNCSGQIVSGGTLTENVAGAASNSGGTMQAAGALTTHAGSLDNTAGHIASLNADGLNVTTTGLLNNGQDGAIGGNGNVTVQAGQIANAGSITAVQNLIATAVQTLFNGGTLAANGNVSASAGTTLTNSGQFGASRALVLSAATFDNSGGTASADQFTLHAANLVNHGGSITQTGTGTTTIDVTGTLDNSAGGTLQTNSTDLTLSSATLDNDGGTITHAGQGKLEINAGNGTGALSNVGGAIVSNGEVAVESSTLDNASGSIIGQNGLTATVGAALNNTNGKLLSNTDLSVASGTLNNDGGQIGAGSNATIHSGSLTNHGGAIVAPNLTVATGSTLDNSGGDIEANQLALGATDLLNHGGTITQYGASPMSVNVSNTLDNSNGGTFQTNSTDLTLAPATLDNDGGTITHAGTGTLTIAPGNGAGSISNGGGKIITAGEIAAQAGSLNNANGVLAAQGNIAANIAGDVNNTQGEVRSLSSLSLASGGTLTNTNGQIQSGTGAAGDASTLGVQAASVDNTDGLVGNLGTGDTTVQGGSQTINSGGAITGNGNVAVNTSSLSNTQGAQLSGENVTVQAGTVDNSGGQIGTFVGPNGDVAITTTGAVTNTNGQIGATHNLSVNAAALTGGGAYSAANDVAVSVQGDFAPTPDLQFNAGHDLTFTLPGTFANGAMLQAVNNLGINAGDIGNSGVMMVGGTLTTHSNTLENTGAMVGGSVSLNANSTISNVGPTAFIGATDSNGTLELLAQDIENRDDTTATDTQATTAIYGLGKVVLASGKDANGNYTSANLIRNQSALIESAGDMELHATQVTNTRTAMTTTGLNQPVDPNLLTQLGISLSGCAAINMAACSGQDVGWATADNPAFLTMIGGVYTVPPRTGQWNSGYQYTTYTGVALANLIASISPQAQIVAGGDLDASHVGLFQNYWSAVAAIGNIAAPVALDQNSWQGQTAPRVQVTYSGYYHYNNYDNTEHDWTLPFGDAPFVGSRPGGYSQAAPADIRSYSLPSYESTFVAGGTLSGTGVSIDNTAGNAGIPSLGLAPGQALSGVNIDGVSGNAGGTKAGAATVNGGSGMVNPVIASATAQNVLQTLTIPQGGLFSPATAPGATWLIETNPAFTNQKTFISSDYYLQQLGLNPQTTEKRLGDGFYEQQLVRNQITSLTGKAVLGPYTDLQSMYQSLLAAGASLAQSLDLPFGMSLSPEQVAALTGNVIIMQTETVNGQQVLVPVVYLAKASQHEMNGPLIAATDIDLRNTQTFSNSGTVQASDTLSIQGQQIDNAFGKLQSGGLMSLTTSGNVDLTSATVNAGSLALNAGGDLLLNTAVKTVDQMSATGATRTTTTLGPIANLNVVGDGAIVTGGNFEQNAGNLNVGGNLGMAVGGNYDLGSVQTGEHKVVERANGVSNTDLNQTTGSSVNVGGISQIGVGGDLTATGANLNLSGGGALAANGNVTFQAAKATSTIDSNSSGSNSHGSYSDSQHLSADTLTGTTLNSGNSLTLASGHDINVTGSTINLDQGTATLAAANNVNIGAATATYVDNSTQTGSHSNMVSGKEVSSSRDTTTTLNQGSMISADGVSISSGKDINVAGSMIVGTNDVALSAVHDVNITTTQDTSQSSSFYEEKKSGFGAMSGRGLSLNYGTSDTKETTHDSSVTNNGSLVGSTNGNLSIQAGNTLHVTGSDLVAAQNVTGVAANVIINAATNTSHHDETQEVKQNGFTLGLSGSVGDAINGAYQQGQALASGNSNGRAEALHAIAAGGNAAMAGMGAADIAGGATGPNAPSIGVQLSFGSSQSKNTFTEDQTTQKGSNVLAGGTAAFVATGDGTTGSGNLTIAGSNVNANDVVLAAKNQVNIVNTTNTDTTASTNKSSSASVGVSYGTQGFGVSASMSNAHGDGNSDAAIQNASHVSGANSVTVVSGGDTNIIGSQVSGGQVTANVGGNLNIESVQDTTVSTAHQSSAGGGFSISQGGGSASFSAQNGHADSNYAQVNEQAGIQAGHGGFDINVKGNTNLTGAVISSTADASQNSLTTGTLTYSDIQNQSHYSATSNGISAGVGVGSTGKATGPGSVSGTPGVSPMISQNESGDSSATTTSGIAAGTITITDAANQTQDIASINRDTSNLNGTVSQTPDVQNILSQQADTMQAAQAAGQVVAQGIGAYAESKLEAAQKAGDTATAAAWAEGGDNRALLHLAGGALIGGLGGGSVFTAVGGGLGAGLSSKLAGQLENLSKGVASETGSELLGNLAANVAAGVGGALVGGTAGAATASNVELYNQMHHQKKDLVSQACGAGAQCSDATLSAAIQAQQALSGAAAENVAQTGVAAGLVAGGAAAIVLGPEAFAAYMAAQAGYSLTTAALTGAGISGGLYTGSAIVGAGLGYKQQDFGAGFDQRFSMPGLAAASTVGAINGMFKTSMFGWAGVANSIKNVTTVPGFVIQANGLALGQFAGKAAQGAVHQNNSTP